MQLRKPGSQLRLKKTSGRVECASLYPFPAGAPGSLLRPILFWEILLPSWNLQPGKAVEEAWEMGWWSACLFLASWDHLGPWSTPSPCPYVTKGGRKELIAQEFFLPSKGVTSLETMSVLLSGVQTDRKQQGELSRKPGALDADEPVQILTLPLLSWRNIPTRPNLRPMGLTEDQPHRAAGTIGVK